MRCQGVVAAILLVLACHKATADLGKENEDKIKKLETLLKETVKADLTTLFAQHGKTIDQAIDVVMKTLDYVDTNIEELKTHIETTVKAYHDNTIENLKQYETDTATMLEKMDIKLTLNLEHINNKSMTERNDIISWAHQRAHLHEDILKTRITACVHDHGHFGKGVVAYSSADGGYVKESVSIRVYNNTDIKREDLLNRNSGIFKVPVNAAGEYSFTFSVTIDSFDQRLIPSSYFFVNNGEKIEGTEVFANTGTSRDQDRVPGHSQVALKLGEGDEISVIQTLATDIQDYHVAFCGALLHLDKASEGPGGLYADAEGPDFPLGTLAEQETWEHKSKEFNDAEDIDYTMKEAEEDKKPKVEDLFGEGKIEDGDWKTTNADWAV